MRCAISCAADTDDVGADDVGARSAALIGPRLGRRSGIDLTEGTPRVGVLRSLACPVKARQMQHKSSNIVDLGVIVQDLS